MLEKNKKGNKTVKKTGKITKRKELEDAGIDPATSRMLSARSTIWANPPSG